MVLEPDQYREGYSFATREDEYLDIIEKTIKGHVFKEGFPFRKFLDVGSGPGKLTQHLAPRFERTVVVEPNETFLSSYKDFNCQFVPRRFENFQTVETFDLIVCSHVLYHIPFDGWKYVIEKMLAHLSPEGTLIIAMEAPWGEKNELHRRFNPAHKDSSDLIKLLEEVPGLKKVYHSKLQTTFSNADELKERCRFFVYADCIPDEISNEQCSQIERDIEVFVESCANGNGLYSFNHAQDIILIR